MRMDSRRLGRDVERRRCVFVFSLHVLWLYWYHLLYEVRLQIHLVAGKAGYRTQVREPASASPGVFLRLRDI